MLDSEDSLEESLSGSISQNKGHFQDEDFPVGEDTDPTADLGSALDRLNADLEDDDLDMMDELVEEAEMTSIRGLDIGNELTDADLLDAICAGMGLDADETKPDFKFDNRPPARPRTQCESWSSGNITKKMRELPRATRAPPDAGDCYLHHRSGSEHVFVVHELTGKTTTVGVAKNSSMKTFRFLLDSHTAFKRACLATEECRQRGSGLGFSSLIHAAACFAIAGEYSKTRSIMEPVEGSDVVRQGIFFEVTGINFRNRATNAHVVINKYDLLNSTLPYCDDLELSLSWSLHEDRRDTSFLKGTGFDVGPSPYTPTVDRLHKATPAVSNSMKAQLVDQLQQLLREQTCDLNPEHEKHLDISLKFQTMWAAIKKKRGFPAPFRALPCLIGPADLELMLQIEPQTCIRPIDQVNSFCGEWGLENYEAAIEQVLPESYLPFDETTTLHEIVFKWLSKFAIMQAITLESELFPKMVGSRGCFFSEYSGCGITWKRCATGSLTFFVSFYAHKPPPITCGRWVKLKAGNGTTYFQSPTFKINQGEIHYAACLPYKVFCKMVATLPYAASNERWYVTKRILQIAKVQHGSTWRTSMICGDFRYITLCAIAGSGDPVGLVESVLGKLGNQPLRSPDYYLLLKMQEFACHYDGSKLHQTPVFDLPIRYLSIEKDLPLGLYWHIRSEKHATDCVKKMFQAAILEKEVRQKVRTYLNLQAEILEAAVENGRFCDNAIADTIHNHPGTPCYNHILFLALSYVASADLKESAGERQHATEASISGMITDHKMAEVTWGPTGLQGSVFRNSTVATGITKLVKELKEPSCIHEMLVRQSLLKPKPSVYTLHPKDAKSGDREISQMLPHMRPCQFFSESMICIYSEAEQLDMMRDAGKYSKVVKTFHGMMKGKVAFRSEDKSFFCGLMQPEMMSLATLCVAIDCGSTSLVSASAFQRMDTHRFVVMPIGFKLNALPSGVDTTAVFRLDRKKPISSVALKLHTHMQQGIRAMGAGLIHTTFIKGFSAVQKAVMGNIESTALFTTSDDSTRAVSVSTASPWNSRSVINEFLHRPLLYLGHAMMEDSVRKPQLSDRLAEFNNVVVGPSGAIPQSFVHADLVMQPLISHNIARDVLDSMALARSSIVWGDSPDLACAAIWGYTVMLRQKWLMSEADIARLIDLGFIPDSIEHAVAGGPHLKPDTLQKLWDSLSPEMQEKVHAGDLDVLSALAKFNFKDQMGDKGKKTKAQVAEVVGGFRTRQAIGSINSSRIFKGKLSGKYVKIAPAEKRAAVRNGFFDTLDRPPGPVSNAALEQFEILRPMKVQVSYVKPRRNYFLPRTQGACSHPKGAPRIGQVLALRMCDIVYETGVTMKEVLIANLPKDEFESWYRKEVRVKNKVGFSFKSCFGLPLSILHEEGIFSSARSVQFTVDVDEAALVVTTFAVGGVVYENVLPCLMGQRILNIAKTQDAVLAFAYQKVGGNVVYFYQRTGEEVSSGVRRAVPAGEPYFIHKNMGKNVLVTLKDDSSPIDVTKYFSPHELENAGALLPCVWGDPVALLSYGDYIKSNHHSAMRMMDRIFKYHNCRRPAKFKHIYFAYPRFSTEPMKVERSATVFLQGSASVRALELTFPATEAPPNSSVTIDLKGRVPVVLASSREDVQADWWEV